MRIRFAVASIAGVLLLSTLALFAFAPPPANFSGTWTFNAQKSQNLGMMAAMKDTVTIRQSPTRLQLQDAVEFGGNQQTHETAFDLSGKPTANKSPLGEAARTTSAWKGAKLVTRWETEGAIAGSKHVSIETRSLSADGRTMAVVTASDKPGAKAITMVFDRQ